MELIPISRFLLLLPEGKLNVELMGFLYVSRPYVWFVSTMADSRKILLTPSGIMEDIWKTVSMFPLFFY